MDSIISLANLKFIYNKHIIISFYAFELTLLRGLNGTHVKQTGQDKIQMAIQIKQLAEFESKHQILINEKEHLWQELDIQIASFKHELLVKEEMMKDFKLSYEINVLLIICKK